MVLDEKNKKWANEWVRRHLEDFEVDLHDGLEFCLSGLESPIEQGFLRGLLAHCEGNLVRVTLLTPGQGFATAIDMNGPFGVLVHPQKQIDRYRVDFYIELHDIDTRLPAPFETIQNVIVECDGHDFHERTKEQAKKDRSRDRDLQALGYHVFRFTGSEIHKDETKCAKEVIDFLEQKNKTQRDARRGAEANGKN